MTLVLRKCWQDGSSSNRFKYGQVRERVICPDWEPEPICGHGLHGLLKGNGDWRLLEGSDWLVIDADDQIVNIDNDKCKFNTGVILFRGTAEELSKSEFPHKFNLNSESAYQWAMHIGNHDIMINKITDPKYAYRWAISIGNIDLMFDKISSSEAAYLWAVDIGNRDVMINKITESRDAYWWAIFIGDKNVMIDKITNSEWAYWWAKDIGNQNVMKSKVTEKYWIQKWNEDFPFHRIES